jgi:Fur family ferric uptake transcriptional regulator
MTIVRPSLTPWPDLRGELHSRGLRWTPQRRLILEVLGSTRGHVTGSEILDRCRQRDPETTPSTVYRTLDVLEELGYVHHSHGADGREEYHVLPETEHAHLTCDRCGASWEIDPVEARELVAGLETAHGFIVNIAHLTIAGRCQACTEQPAQDAPVATH